MTGHGIATYANGHIYEGAFVKGKRSGQGTMRYTTGQEESGVWENGALSTAPETTAETETSN
jgi:hypothetical protein